MRCQELAAAHDKIAQMHSRLAVCEASGANSQRSAFPPIRWLILGSWCGVQQSLAGPTLDNLKKSHASLAAEKSTQDAHHATLAERVEFLERRTHACSAFIVLR